MNPKWYEDFPLLNELSNKGKTIVYLDSAASAQKPKSVIDAISHYYCHDHANIHRGIYSLSAKATSAYEGARHKVRDFIHAANDYEIIFTRGTTESINLVASSFGKLQIKPGDEILISVMEHHSNIVPWQVLCEQTGALLKVVPVREDGSLDVDEYRALLTDRTRLVALAHVSNVLGTVNPVKQLIEWAHDGNIPVLLDGAQAVPHIPVNVQDLKCDFYVFSSHKLYGPTGVGVLYGRSEWLERMPPYQLGGNMISHVSFEKTDYNVLPYKFEAGTPSIAGVIGLGVALDYINQIGMENIQAHESGLTSYMLQRLSQLPGLRMIGTAPGKMGVFAFTLEQAHAHDVGTLLDYEGIAVRAGHHCAMPLMERFQVPATVRASLGLYNRAEDVDRLILGLEKAINFFDDKSSL